MSYYQVHMHERKIIARLYNEGCKAGKIARMIFRSRSTVLREIKRNGFEGRDGKWYYNAKVAQALYRKRQKAADRQQCLSPAPMDREENWRSYYERKTYPLSRKRKWKKNRSGKKRSHWFRSWWDDRCWTSWSWRGKAWRQDYNKFERLRRYRTEEESRTNPFKNRRRWGYLFPDRFQHAPLFSRRRKRKISRWDRRKFRYPDPRSRRWRDPFLGGFLEELPELLRYKPPAPQRKSPHRKLPVPAHLSTFPAVTPQPAGRTMSEPQIFKRILKIPSLFHGGSPRFLLECG